MTVFEEHDFQMEELTLAEAIRIDQENIRWYNSIKDDYEREHNVFEEQGFQMEELTLAEAIRIDQENIRWYDSIKDDYESEPNAFEEESTEGMSQYQASIEQENEDEMSLSQAVKILMQLNEFSE